MRFLFAILFEPWRFLIKLRILLENSMSIIPTLRFLRDTRNDECPITLHIWFNQKVLGINKLAYWPMHISSQVSHSEKILIGKHVNPGYQYGCYLHGVNGIIIGDYTFVAPNVGIMSGNHNPVDLRQQIKAGPIKIGRHCWLGMNSMILANVELGDFTIVAAGSIVTKSFKEGFCIIGGNPAKVLKILNSDDCVPYEVEFSHIGYIKAEQFDKIKVRVLENICAE
jgi:acetyltransferase-like isoleucine patch superfamily enzyme